MVRPARKLIGECDAGQQGVVIRSEHRTSSVAVAVIETRVAKLRLFRVHELLGVSFVLALLAVTSSFLLR